MRVKFLAQEHNTMSPARSAKYSSSLSSPMPPIKLQSKREEMKPAFFLQIFSWLFCDFSAFWLSTALSFYQNLNRQRCARLPRYHNHLRHRRQCVPLRWRVSDRTLMCVLPPWSRAGQSLVASILLYAQEVEERPRLQLTSITRRELPWQRCVAS